MNREQFEMLLSEWLDQPGSSDLRTRVEAEAQRTPEHARLRDEWLAANAALRAAEPPAVDWDRLRDRISRSIDDDVRAELAPDRLDDLLKRDAADFARVQWTALRGRISAAVRAQAETHGAADAAADGPRVIRLPLRRSLAGLGLAIAAAWAFFALRPASTVTDSSPMRTFGAAGRLVAVAEYAPPPDWRPTEQVAEVSPSKAIPPSDDGEFFLMIEPAAPRGMRPASG